MHVSDVAKYAGVSIGADNLATLLCCRQHAAASTGAAITAASPSEHIMFVANDWHAALLPLYLSARYKQKGVYDSAHCVLAIHNLAHQGSFPAHHFHELSLPGEWYRSLNWRDPNDSHKTQTINVLKVGADDCGTCQPYHCRSQAPLPQYCW